MFSKYYEDYFYCQEENSIALESICPSNYWLVSPGWESREDSVTGGLL